MKYGLIKAVTPNVIRCEPRIISTRIPLSLILGYLAASKKVHSGKATVDDVFIVTPGTGAGKIFSATVKAFGSISVWPFYGL